MFKRILIANRGEIAARIIRAAKKLGIETVAVYSRADQQSPHLRHADKAVCLGPGQSTQSYLNMQAVLQAALQNHCQAIHPGYGFLSENPLFATLCEQYKVTFIGPPPQAIRSMGDKASARETMKAAGLDIIPGSRCVVKELEQMREVAREIGFPVLLKATAGGGGKGMRVCLREEDLADNFAQASLEAEKAFGNPALYLEKYIEHGRHIEFQILADAFGNAVHLGERECSVQRRHQKLIEESPSPAMDPKLREYMGVRVAQAVCRIGYRNAGTVEFLMDGSNLYFMEMNARLQVEHPVTEMVTGIDIVEEQIKIAAHHQLSLRQEEIAQSGHAIECRINAEDPAKGFQPSPGRISRFRPPEQNDKVRIETFVEEGYQIPPFYDSMICKLIVREENREAAIDSMRKSLENFEVEGVATTIPFLLKVLQHPKFLSGNYHTKILEEIR